MACSSDGMCSTQILDSANNAISGASSKGQVTLGKIGNLMTNAGSNLQNILSATQKTEKQIQSARQQFKAGQKVFKDLTTSKKKESKSITSDTLKNQKQVFEAQKAQIMTQNTQRLNALKAQLKQEEERQKAQMKAIEKQISATQVAISQAMQKEKNQQKAQQIIAKLKLEQMAKQEKDRK